MSNRINVLFLFYLCLLFPLQANGAPVPPVFSKKFSPEEVAVGEVSTLTFTIDNTGTSIPVSELAFTDYFPAGMAVANPPNAFTTCTGGTLTAIAGTSTITYESGTVTPAAFCTISVDVIASSAGNLLNTSEEITSEYGNSGTASDTLTVTNLVDLSLQIFENIDPIAAGEELIYTVKVTNNGPNTGEKIIVNDSLPGEVSFVSTSCTDYFYDAGELACTLGTISAGGSAQYAVTVNVDPGITQTIENTATIEAKVTDPDLTNNSATVTTSVVDPPLVTTATVESVTSSSSIGGGNISNATGAGIIERGVCWSISSSPTIDDICVTETVSGDGAGDFSMTLIPLKSDTFYYVRSFVSYSVGTVYGSEKTFTTLPFPYHLFIPAINHNTPD
mgnify:CR=1 FL=1